MAHRLLLAAAAYLAAMTSGAAVEDKITALPGADADVQALSMYSGFLDLEGTAKHVAYWLVENEGADDDAPLALWTNGGPGCSGFIALMTEMGPFSPTANGTLAYNAHGWHTAAHMLFVEQPAGVGFSYSDERADYVTGDFDAARDLFLTIRAFYAKFPEYGDLSYYFYRLPSRNTASPSGQPV